MRSENLVHSLEHGAVWIAYNPDQVTGDALKTLKSKVDGEQYMVMSPYPSLDSPVSLQSWGHQLKVTDVNDPRIDQFISSLQAEPVHAPRGRARAVTPSGRAASTRTTRRPSPRPPAVGAPGPSPR